MHQKPIKPVRMPAVRDRLVRHLRTDQMSRHALTAMPGTALCQLPGLDAGQPGVFARRFQGPVPLEYADRFLTRTADQLEDARLYWIAADFCDLAGEAADSLPDLTFQPDEVPAPCGLVYFETPAHVNTHAGQGSSHPPVDTDAIAWFTVPQGIWVIPLMRPDSLLAYLGRDRIRDQVGYLMPHSPGGGAVYGTHDNQPGGFRILAVLLATWFLIAQPGVADTQPGPVDRTEQRKYNRAGRAYPGVNVVNLRRRPVPEGRDAPQGVRDYQVRWIVSGHWRDQAHGPQWSLRRRQYIAPYLKGPDDAPVKAPVPTVHKVQ